MSVVARVLDKRRRELTVIERDLSKLEAIQKPFPRMTYDDAVKTLQAKGLPIQWGGDFGGPDETTLSEQYDRPLMVHRYPAAVKAFYMKPDPDRAELALGVDVLAPEGYGEIIGGGERLADLDLLLQRIKEHDLPQEAFEWYLDLRRYGIGAARRVRHGHRAGRRVDLQARTRPGDDSVPAHALQAVPLNVSGCVLCSTFHVSTFDVRRSTFGTRTKNAERAEPQNATRRTQRRT